MPLRSESSELRRLISLLRSAQKAAGGNDLWIDEAQGIAENLLAQLGDGIHVNPGLVVFGNPRGREMSGDVMAVLYRHKEDGEFYCHGFGNADIRLDGDPDNGVSIEGLRTRTGVTMTANSDGSITLRHKSRKLWGDF